MDVSWNVVFSALLAASVVVPEPLWGIERGWQNYRTCRQHLRRNDACRALAEQRFKANFPDRKLDWPACRKDDVAEAILWAAISDARFIERYMRQFQRLCR